MVSRPIIYYVFSGIIILFVGTLMIVDRITEKSKKSFWNGVSVKSYKNSLKHTDSTHRLDCKIPPLDNLMDFYNYGSVNKKSSCTNLAEVGGIGRNKVLYPYNEASRIVCLDDVIQGNCTVVSFGVGMDTTFEDEMAKEVDCRVYMFDPTIGKEDFKSPPNKQFFNLGLYDQKGLIQIGNTISKVDRYASILQMLNLINQPIDYLKIDVEALELNFFKDVHNTSSHLLDNVRQLGMELHPILYMRSKGTLTECQVPPLVKLEDFFQYGKISKQARCTNLAEMGGNYRRVKSAYPYNEGSRIVCLDVLTRGNCKVLSFGVASGDTFEVDMADVAECQVFVFDPTFGREDFISPYKDQFFNLGLNDAKGRVEINGTISKVDRYESIVEMLNLTKALIDYLKIDFRFTELKFLKDVLTKSSHLLNNVQQFAMEIHPVLHMKSQGNITSLEAFQPYWKAMHELECRGFQMLSFVPNLFPNCQFSFNGQEASGCYDIVYLNRLTNF